MAAAPLVAGEEQLTGGKFYGSVVSKQAVGAIFTELQHSEPRKLPAHSHELPFFSLVFGRDYAEKYGRRDVQFRRFTFAYRPAGVPIRTKLAAGVRACSASKSNMAGSAA